jgi:hypothetical protein
MSTRERSVVMRAGIPFFILASVSIVSAGCGAAESNALGDDDIIAAPPLRITLGAEALAPGESLTAVARLTEPAPEEGALIVLSSNDDDALTMPATITVAAHAYAARFTVSNRYAGPRKSVTVFAAYEDSWAEKSLLVPSAPESICNLHVCLQ